MKQYTLNHTKKALKFFETLPMLPICFHDIHYHYVFLWYFQCQWLLHRLLYIYFSQWQEGFKHSVLPKWRMPCSALMICLGFFTGFSLGILLISLKHNQRKVNFKPIHWGSLNVITSFEFNMYMDLNPYMISSDFHYIKLVITYFKW